MAHHEFYSWCNWIAESGSIITGWHFAAVASWLLLSSSSLWFSDREICWADSAYGPAVEYVEQSPSIVVHIGIVGVIGVDGYLCSNLAQCHSDNQRGNWGKEISERKGFTIWIKEKLRRRSYFANSPPANHEDVTILKCIRVLGVCEMVVPSPVSLPVLMLWQWVPSPAPCCRQLYFPWSSSESCS